MLTVANTTFSGNSAFYDGGGIYNHGTLTVLSSTFSSNSFSTFGGGISNDGRFTVIGCNFSGNQPNMGGDRGGGGIFTNFGTVAAVTNSTFSGAEIGKIYHSAGPLWAYSPPWGLRKTSGHNSSAPR
jgi:predicted outer membrane repeat protein